MFAYALIEFCMINFVQVGVEVPEFLGEGGAGGDAGGDDDEDWG